MQDLQFYPPSPELEPSEFTKLSSKYKLQVALACLGILLFILLYTALIGFFIYVLNLSIQFLQFRPSLLSIASVLGALMLLLFTVKFIFKIKSPKNEERFEISPSDHPELTQFIKKICEEVGTNEPNAIYLVPDVNAYVSYSNLFLSLLGSQKKDLTIGLGLIGALNLSEFKAVIAHEFGHFSQRSMRIGIYIMTVNTIIHDMIFDRDKWDELLAGASGIGFGIGLIALLIGLLVSLIRVILSGFYQLLNRAYLSLSREMEFNADKFAVSITGSEAISSSLWKLDHFFGDWNETLDHLYLANNNNMSVENVFPAVERSFQKKKGEVSKLYEALKRDELGSRVFFSSHEHAKVSMYATHPPNYLRESNAKNPFIQGVVDERSPWILFKQHSELQKQATNKIYQSLFGEEAGKQVPFEQFLSFIEQEENESRIYSTYGKGLEQHVMNLPSESRLEQLRLDHPVPGVDLKSLILELDKATQPFRSMSDSIKEMMEISEGSTRKKEVVIDNKSYSVKQFQQAQEHIERLWNEHYEKHLRPWDEKYFQYFYKKACILNQEKKIIPWYDQERRISAVCDAVDGAHEYLIKTITFLEGKAEVTDAMIRIKSSDIALETRKANDVIQHITNENYLPLPNISSIELLKTSMLPKGMLDCSSRILEDGNKINQLAMDLEKARILSMRVKKKNLCQILLLHQELENHKS